MNIISDASILANPVAAEAELESIYLGSDMDAICDVAIASCDKVMIANAALPLENRLHAFRNWRKKAFAEWLRKDSDFQLYYSSLGSDIQETINNGTASLSEVVNRVSALSEEIKKRCAEARKQSKERLRSSVLSHLRDSDGTEDRLIIPQYIAILESGEVGLFRRRGACLDWVKASGVSYVLFSVDHGSDSVRYIVPGDS